MKTASAPRSRLLLVEDTPPFAASLTKGLGEEGFAVSHIATGREALARLVVGAQRESPAVEAVVLDLGLPDMDGLDVLRAARADGLAAPILVLTARDAISSRVAALDGGADDYLIKPFAFAELLARLRALLRRAAAPRWAPLMLGAVVLAPAQGEEAEA